MQSRSFNTIFRLRTECRNGPGLDVNGPRRIYWLQSPTESHDPYQRQMLVKQNSEKLNSRNIFQYGIDLKSVFDIGEHYDQSARQVDVA